MFSFRAFFFNTVFRRRFATFHSIEFCWVYCVLFLLKATTANHARTLQTEDSVELNAKYIFISQPLDMKTHINSTSVPKWKKCKRKGSNKKNRIELMVVTLLLSREMHTFQTVCVRGAVTSVFSSSSLCFFQLNLVYTYRFSFALLIPSCIRTLFLGLSL